MVAWSEKNKLYAGIGIFVLMVLVFIYVRLVIQGGRRLLTRTPYEYPLTIVVFIILGLVLYYLAKRRS
jgi:uncharacterized membrane protein